MSQYYVIFIAQIRLQLHINSATILSLSLLIFLVHKGNYYTELLFMYEEACVFVFNLLLHTYIHVVVPYSVLHSLLIYTRNQNRTLTTTSCTKYPTLPTTTTTTINIVCSCTWFRFSQSYSHLYFYVRQVEGLGLALVPRPVDVFWAYY